MLELEVRALRVDDDRSQFRAGQLELDRFFQRYAGQNQFRHHVGVTYVAVTSGEERSIVGFATLSASQIACSDLPVSARRRLPHYPLPVLRLARLAVDERTRGQGVALRLMRTTFVLAREMALGVGCVGVVVDAKADAVAFYERFGFETLLDVREGALGDRPRATPMFLPLRLIPKTG